jgi:hypothetical protein
MSRIRRTLYQSPFSTDLKSLHWSFSMCPPFHGLLLRAPLPPYSIVHFSPGSPRFLTIQNGLNFIEI